MNAEKALSLLVNLWAAQNGLEVTKLTIIKKENNHERASKPVHRPQDRRTAAAP